jgi:hypothetical protein
MIYFRIAVATIDLLLAATMLYLLLLAMKSTPGSLPSELRRRAGNVLIGIAGFVLLGSGSLKFAHVQHVVAEMTFLGFAGWKLELVASLEILSGVLFLIRPLRSVGLLVASGYLGGAISAHVQGEQYFAVLPTMVILGCCWVGTALRHPQILWSLSERNAAQKSAQEENLPGGIGFHRARQAVR